MKDFPLMQKKGYIRQIGWMYAPSEIHVSATKEIEKTFLYLKIVIDCRLLLASFVVCDDFNLTHSRVGRRGFAVPGAHPPLVPLACSCSSCTLVTTSIFVYFIARATIWITERTSCHSPLVSLKVSVMVRGRAHFIFIYSHLWIEVSDKCLNL